jgi:hypothetical protein
MATLIFVVLRLARVVNVEPPFNDLMVFCQLLAMDTISLAIIVNAVIRRRAKKQP